MKKMIIILLILQIGSLFAQPGNRRTRMGNQGPGVNRTPGMVNQMPRTNRMESLMIWRMTEELQLTPEQSQQLFPVMQKYRDEIDAIDKLRTEKGQAIFSRAIRDVEISEEEFASFLEEKRAFDVQKIELRTAYIKSLESILTIEQRVRLLYFDEKFKAELQRNIKQRWDAVQYK